ncbi:IS5 family transposase [Pseudovibrio axinellae]|nr:IS5 family transposase [Pseudovibrio axinellae]
MPFKYNVDRRHKFNKAEYKVTNWALYNESLRRRGDIAIWVDASIANGWFAPAGKHRGRPCIFSELAIETCLIARSVFGLALRQAQGFMRSIFTFMGLLLPVPDCSTLSRTAGGLKLSPAKSKGQRAPAALVIDSTGLKVFGAGEWQETKYGVKRKRRKWRKLHLGLDLDTGEILCSELTEDNVSDPTVVSDLLDQVEGSVATFLGDGAYDGEPTRREIANRYDGVEIVVPPSRSSAAVGCLETACWQGLCGA